MKILHLWASDHYQGGGGAVSMYRLHSNLRKSGLDSRILCENKTTASSYVMTTPGPTRLESLIQKFTGRLGLNDIHRVRSSRIKHHESFRNSDLLHFHGLHTGFISYLALPSLTRDKPAVFTMRDIWALTGHCAVNYDCERWRTGCGACPYLDANPPVRRDATRIEWKLKDWAYSRSNLTIVSPSGWLTECARQGLLARFPVHHIPNGVDTEAYSPMDPEKCRWLLGIPSGKKVIMVAGLNLNLYSKGSDLFRDALGSLPPSLKKEMVLLLLGPMGEATAEALGLQTVELGFVANHRLKALAYSAADLFVHPTRSDNLPLVVMESLACGTPVVSFEVGGVPELVRPGVTGHLAPPEDSRNFRDGIVRLLGDEALRQSMGQRCRKVAVEEYRVELEVERHIELYRRVLHGSVGERTAKIDVQSASDVGGRPVREPNSEEQDEVEAVPAYRRADEVTR